MGRYARVKNMQCDLIPAPLQGRQVRRILWNNEWWFAVEDVCAALMDTDDGGACWRQLRLRLESEGCAVSTLYRSLPLVSSGGTPQPTECVTLEGVFRMVQSMPSSNAEMFKRWLARVGAKPSARQGPQADLVSVFAMLEEAARGMIACHEDGDGGEAQKRAARIAEDVRKKIIQETIRYLE